MTRLLPLIPASMPIPEAAARYFQSGWIAFPVSGAHKRPLIKWSADPGQLPSSPETAQSLFAEMQARHGQVMVGIALPKDIVVLDIDHRLDRGWDAIAIRSQLAECFGVQDTTPEAHTPSGGRHLWLKLPDGAQARNWTSGHGRFPSEGVDIRTKGGFVIVPPSVRHDGQAYRWINAERDLPTASRELVEALRPPAPPIVSKPLPQDPRHLSRYVEVAYTRELANVRLAPRGGRNAQLFKSAASLGSFVGAGVLPADHVLESLLMAATESGLTREDGSPSVQATIQSGLRTGMASPRQLPEVS